jgi:hypothetical protein
MLKNIVTIFDKIVATYKNQQKQQQKEMSVVSKSLKIFFFKWIG